MGRAGCLAESVCRRNMRLQVSSGEGVRQREAGPPTPGTLGDDFQWPLGVGAASCSNRTGDLILAVSLCLPFLGACHFPSSVLSFLPPL